MNKVLIGSLLLAGMFLIGGCSDSQKAAALSAQLKAAEAQSEMRAQAAAAEAQDALKASEQARMAAEMSMQESMKAREDAAFYRKAAEELQAKLDAAEKMIIDLRAKLEAKSEKQ
ncbi:MAG: hypothetical protein U0892_09380 [Pirellulales bacterium]